MKHLRTFLLPIILTLNLVQSANILGIFPMPLRSHFQVFSPLLEKLAERGHRIDVLSHFPRERPLKGYLDYSVKGSVIPVTDYKIGTLKFVSTLDILNIMNYYCGVQLCSAIINTTATKELMRSNQNYDLIITETFFTDCLLGFATLSNASIIGITTSINLPWISDFIGLPDNPSYIPHYYTSFTKDMNYFERVYNAISLIFVKLWYNRNVLEYSNQFIQEHFNTPPLHVRDILKNISLLMVNSHFSMQQSRPMTPNFVEIGGIHIKAHPILQKDHEDYVKTDLQGVVYISFGTLFKSETFPDNILVNLFEALSAIPYKILWKGERSNVAKHLIVPKNIHFVRWVPQTEVLCHPNLKLFITHCGLASVQETTYCGKPFLGIPVWADQLLNANTAVSKGMGISIPFFEMTKEKISDALKELLENPIYSRNAKRASELFRDRPMSPLDTAVYWTEYVIRHKGATHLRSKGTDLKWYQYYCADILLMVCVIILLFILFIYKLSKSLIACTHRYGKLFCRHYKDKMQ